ncbi:MAG TPA: polysaccharide deacetylase family protein [Anaerolineales bacterium]|nr:polysaccharide deacetylase family protein [Anaerolineales bacterium]
MYHRVVDLPFDPQLLSVKPQHFEEHLEILRRYAWPISLEELTSALRKDRLPRGGVAITFDDGYADNLHDAKPLLERHDIPATIFVTAGQVGRRKEFWWDELERLLLQPGILPETLSLEVNGNEYYWDTSEAIRYAEEDYEIYRAWHVEKPDDPTPRHKLYRSIYLLLHSLYETEQQEIIEQLKIWAGWDAAYRPAHRTLTEAEVFLLAKGSLIKVGAHTMTHPALARLPVSMQCEEIMQSKACLEEILGHRVDSFAYPHGSYSDETISLIKAGGFTCACSSDTAVVSPGADIFCLPRYSMRDWNGEEFYRWLKGLINI